MRVWGGMRVLANWRLPATDLIQMTPMLHYMGLGVGANLWPTYLVGADFVFRRAASAGT
jgi:hypothetical protein